MKALGRLAGLALVAACATTGAEGEGDRNLPTAGVGPFRKLEPEEVKGVAPFVLDDARALYREPAVLRDGESTLLYAVARVDEADVIVRTRALDERTFFGTSGHFGHKPVTVLEPDAPWEGALSGPTLVRFRGEILLFYAGAEGIGLARSTDGLTFRKEPGPVLTRDPLPGSWETTAPRAPSVFALPDGRLRMLFAAGRAIGEAESADGVAWSRVGGEPVLVPAPPPAPGSLLPNEKPPFDTAAVGDPCVVTRTTPAGRFHVRVLYTGTDTSGATAVGFAARYGESGPLARQTVPVYSVGQKEAAPALLDLGDSSFLYVQQDRRDGDTSFVAVAAAFAPGNVKLPPSGDYPDSP
ncbi:MAG: hypothetical protein KF764_23335 [Labilithrix sp.]|nr:hypothetical protein [Labilithrix sp.]